MLTKIVTHFAKHLEEFDTTLKKKLASCIFVKFRDIRDPMFVNKLRTEMKLTILPTSSLEEVRVNKKIGKDNRFMMLPSP